MPVDSGQSQPEIWKNLEKRPFLKFKSVPLFSIVRIDVGFQRMGDRGEWSVIVFIQQSLIAIHCGRFSAVDVERVTIRGCGSCSV